MTTQALTHSTTANGQPATDSGRRKWIALFVIAMAQLMVVLDASVVNIALPKAQVALHISEVDRQWVVTAYTLSFGGLLLLGGRISDFLGRRRMLIVGLLGFAASSALGGAAADQWMLFGARALQGVFAAIMAPAALALITVTFTEAKDRAAAFGVYGAISGGGAAIGLIVGGALTQISWRLCLFINIPIALIAATGAVIFVSESRAEGKGSYDIPGAVLVSGGLVALVYGFTEAAKTGVGWLAPTTIGLLVASVVLLAGFVRVEMRAANPLLPMRVLLERNRAGSFLTLTLIGSGLFAMFLFLTYYLQSNLGYSPLRTGFAFLPFSIGIVIGATTASKLLPRTGPRVLLLTGLVSATAGMLLLLGITATSSWFAHVLPGEVFISLGIGCVFVPIASTALIGIADNDAGVGSAMVNTTQQIGGALGTALLSTFYASAVAGYLADHHTGPSSALQGLAEIHGYHIAFAIGAAMLAVAVVVVAVLIRAGKDDLPTDAAVGM